MRTPGIIIALALLSSPLRGEEVTEAQKIEALKLGFILNGFSMTRPLSEGSIDVSKLLTGSSADLGSVTPAPAPPPVPVVPYRKPSR